MSRPKGSAKTPGSGRRAGTPNHATAEIKEAARAEGVKMIRLFASIANNPKKPDAIPVQAAKELLDRGYGRPAQPVGGEPEEPITVIVRRFFPTILPKMKERSRRHCASSRAAD